MWGSSRAEIDARLSESAWKNRSEKGANAEPRSRNDHARHRRAVHVHAVGVHVDPDEPAVREARRLAAAEVELERHGDTPLHDLRSHAPLDPPHVEHGAVRRRHDDVARGRHALGVLHQRVVHVVGDCREAQQQQHGREGQEAHHEQGAGGETRHRIARPV